MILLQCRAAQTTASDDGILENRGCPTSPSGVGRRCLVTDNGRQKAQEDNAHSRLQIQ